MEQNHWSSDSLSVLIEQIHNSDAAFLVLSVFIEQILLLYREILVQKNNSFYILTSAMLASIPFDGLAIEAGARLRFSNIIGIISTLLFVWYFITTKTRLIDKSYSLNFAFRVLSLFIFSTLVANLIFFSEVINPQAIAYFSETLGDSRLSFFRTELKPVQAFIATISQLSWILIPTLAIQTNEQVVKLAWIYVTSSSIQASLGIFQFLYYLVSGVNLFPIYRGSLLDESIATQDAFFSLGGVNYLRVNAFTGEPKNLALVLCFSIAIVCFFLIQQTSHRPRAFVIACGLIQFFALMLTFSTLGYALLTLTCCVYFYFQKNKTLFIVTIASIVIPIFFLLGVPSIVSDIFQERILERIGIEDFDLVYLDFISKAPDNLLLGTGFGTFHLASFESATQLIKWQFGIILPKIGLFGLMATSGCVGTLIFSSLFIKLIAKLSYFSLFSTFPEGRFCISIRNLVVCLVVIGILFRFTTFGCLWLGIGFTVLDNNIRYLDYLIQSSNLYRLGSDFYSKTQSE
jgi:hypothetical protein